MKRVWFLENTKTVLNTFLKNIFLMLKNDLIYSFEACFPHYCFLLQLNIHFFLKKSICFFRKEHFLEVFYSFFLLYLYKKNNYFDNKTNIILFYLSLCFITIGGRLSL